MSLLPVGGLLLLVAACTPSAYQPTPSDEATRVVAPVFVATPLPTASPQPFPPTATPIAPPVVVVAETPDAPGVVYVTRTGGQGLALRLAPGGEQLATISEGTALTLTGEEQQAAGRLWRQVREGTGREGWVAADFLTAADQSAPATPPMPSPAASPEPTATAVPAPSATPTWPVPLIPTATHSTEPPPTRTRPPVLSPAPTGTALPLVVPRVGPGSQPRP